MGWAMDNLDPLNHRDLPAPNPNGDESAGFGPGGTIRYIGNFHKSLPHNEFGEVDPPAAYQALQAALPDLPMGPGDLEHVPPGPLSHPAQAALNRDPTGGGHIERAATLNNPQSGYSRERVGPEPEQLNMPPPPRVLSASAAAEFTELYWMALQRDVSLELLESDDNDATAIAELKDVFTRGINDVSDPGRLRLGLDLPTENGHLSLNKHTLYRCGLKDEDQGPLVSQFFLHDVPFGTFTVVQKQFPYAPGLDYLTDHRNWLLAQNTGYDRFGRSYSSDNDFGDNHAAYEAKGAVQRRIGSMRDLARFVNKDALHEAYFNAALLLSNWKAKVDAGNPYRDLLKRQGAFGTLGDPNLLALVSEVATRALQVVWRQKWIINRRLRPEAYGGLMQMQRLGYDGGSGSVTRAYGLPDWVFETEAAQAILNQRHERGEADAYFLPMAFTAGSPTHPAHGAGHATVAGACVTVLKAWYQEDDLIAPMIRASSHPQTRAKLDVLQPKKTVGDLPAYAGGDEGAMTVGGELNKIASNVAMGRSMGGVHWRTDNTRSLRLGEQVATMMLVRHIADYSETPVSMTYTNFDRHEVRIDKTGVRVTGDPALQALYDSILP